MNVYRLPVDYGSAAPRTSANWPSVADSSQVGQNPVDRHFPYEVTFDPHDLSIRCITQPRGAACNGIQDRLDIGRRAGDYTQDLTRGRLLLERLSEFTIAHLLLVKKPCVLDGDHGLVRKGFKQFDLPVRERTDFPSADMNGTNGNTFTE